MRKFFPAANAPDGFFSRFDNIYNEKEDKKVIYIKGGSGTGKSTLMKRLTDDALNSGIEVEQFLCSSDPDSLDGVRFLDTKTSIVDATSPHIQDPLMPGISGNIYNVADFLNDEILKPFKNEIIKLSEEKKNCFNTCYKYLKSAQMLYPKWSGNILSNPITDKFKFVPTGSSGKTRYLFASGITPKGNINLLGEILIGKIIGIEESIESSAILKALNQKANMAGYNTELYFCPIFPDSKAEHLVINELNLSFTTLNQHHKFEKCSEVIEATNKPMLPDEIKPLIDTACVFLAKAKTYHSQIEKIYISAMDFDSMNKSYEELKQSCFWGTICIKS